MRVLVLYNPIAGAGRSADEARRLRAALAQAGHDAALAETRLEPTREWLDGALVDRELMVIVGGDGAVRLACDAAERSGTPIYHYPLGTENLFARQFGGSRSPDDLLGAIERFQVQRVDVGVANDRRFLLMASLGFDAEVIHDLSQRRGGSISHLTYIVPILASYHRWRPPHLTVRIDDGVAVDDAPGCVVVANSRQYAVRIDPAVNASMTDGLLDVVFFPMKSRRALLKWVIASRLRRHVASRRLVYRRGREVRVETNPPQRYQLDGDPPESGAEDGCEGGEKTTDLRISLRPKGLGVLLP